MRRRERERRYVGGGGAVVPTRKAQPVESAGLNYRVIIWQKKELHLVFITFMVFCKCPNSRSRLFPFPVLFLFFFECFAASIHPSIHVSYTSISSRYISRRTLPKLWWNSSLTQLDWLTDVLMQRQLLSYYLVPAPNVFTLQEEAARRTQKNTLALLGLFAIYYKASCTVLLYLCTYTYLYT